MKGVFKVFTVIIVACTVIGCAQPIGNIGGSGSSRSDLGDSLEAIPKRTMYNIPQKFLRDIDLTVFISYQGNALRIIPINEVEISIVEDLSEPDVRKPVSLDPDLPYVFESKGQKMILVEYNNLSDAYYVNVSDPFEMGGDGNNGNGDAPGIEIIWVTP